MGQVLQSCPLEHVVGPPDRHRVHRAVLRVLAAVEPQQPRQRGPRQPAVHLVDRHGEPRRTLARALLAAPRPHHGPPRQQRVVHLPGVLRAVHPRLGVIPEELEPLVDGVLEDIRVGHLCGEVGRLAAEVHHVGPADALVRPPGRPGLGVSVHGVVAGLLVAQQLGQHRAGLHAVQLAVGPRQPRGQAEVLHLVGEDGGGGAALHRGRLLLLHLPVPVVLGVVSVVLVAALDGELHHLGVEQRLLHPPRLGVHVRQLGPGPVVVGPEGRLGGRVAVLRVLASVGRAEQLDQVGARLAAVERADRPRQLLQLDVGRGTVGLQDLGLLLRHVVLGVGLWLRGSGGRISGGHHKIWWRLQQEDSLLLDRHCHGDGVR